MITTWEGLRSGAATLRVHETDAGGSIVVEPRVIDGLPALVQYQPRGGDRNVVVSVFDSETEMRYVVRGYDSNLSGSNDDAVIAIARSLYQPVSP